MRDRLFDIFSFFNPDLGNGREQRNQSQGDPLIPLTGCQELCSVDGLGVSLRI